MSRCLGRRGERHHPLLAGRHHRVDELFKERDECRLPSTHDKRLGYGGLSTVFAGKYAWQGHVNDAQIEPQRGIADVPLVKGIFLLRGKQFPAIDLSPAGYSWANRQPYSGVGG